MPDDTALLRRLTPLDAWALALGCIIGWGAFIMPGTTFLPQAGPLGSLVALFAAALVMVVIALNFHFMMRRLPMAGGAFTYATKTFGRGHGFVCAWFLALAYLVPIPLNATALAMISRNLMGGVLEMGPSYDISGYSVYSGEIVLIVAVLAVFAYAAMRNSKVVGVMQVVLVLCLVGGVVVISVAALLSPATSVAALQPAFSPNSAPLVGVLVIVATSPWAFVGFDVLSQITEETAFSVRRLGLIMVLAIAAGAAIYVALNTIAASVVPAGYANWAEYVADTPNLTGLEAMPLFNAVYTIMGPAGLVVLDITTLGAILTGIIGFYMASSRIFYAMARQEVLPPWFGILHGKYHSPRNAILIILLVALVASFFGRTILGWVIDMLSVSTAIGFFYTSAAVWRHALAEGKLGWLALGVAGVLFSVAFLVLLLVPNPLLGIPLSQESYVFLVAWAALGVNFFIPRYQESETQLERSARETAIDA